MRDQDVPRINEIKRDLDAYARQRGYKDYGDFVKKAKSMKVTNIEVNNAKPEVRYIKQSDIARCPHRIFAPSHYRENGSCKCNDPKETVMAEWGYKWRNGKWQ